MSENPRPANPGEPGGPHPYYQNFQHTPVGARIPEKIGRGAFSTALMILQTNEIFVLDFLAMSVPPQQVVARIIMTAGQYSQFVTALGLNIKQYESQFGPIKPHHPTMAPAVGQTAPGHAVPSPAPGAPGQPAPGGAAPLGPGVSQASTLPPELGGVTPESVPPVGHGGAPGPVTELYEQVKFPEELLSGAFANAVMIRHTPEEFCFDFISSLYPRPMVVSRVYAAAARARSFLDAMGGALERFRATGGHPPMP